MNLPTPFIFAKSSEFEDSRIKHQSFNAWTKKYNDCDLSLFTKEQLIQYGQDMYNLAKKEQPISNPTWIEP